MTLSAYFIYFPNCKFFEEIGDSWGYRSINPKPLHKDDSTHRSENLEPCQCLCYFLYLTPRPRGRKPGDVLPSIQLYPSDLCCDPPVWAGWVTLYCLSDTLFIFYYITRYSIICLCFWTRHLSVLASLPLKQMFYLVCRCPFLPPSLCLCTFLSSSLIPSII